MGSKKCIEISRSYENVELLDLAPPLADFWKLLLCRGGSLVGEVNVGIVKNGDIVPPANLPLPPPKNWYPRSLVKTLLMVSGANL